MDLTPATPRPVREAPPLADALVAGYRGPAAVIDSQGMVLSTNPAARPFLAVARPWHHRSTAPTGDEAVPDSGAVTEYLWNGDRVVIRWAVVPVPGTGSAGEPLQVLFGIDVTLDANMRTALAESRRRFRDLSSLAGDIAWETDQDGRLVYLSMAPGFGYRSDRLLGRPARELIAAEVGGVDPLTPRRPVRDLPVWLRTADGGQILCAIAVDPIVDADGVFLGARGLGSDITERQAREAHLAELHERDRLIGMMAGAMRHERGPDEALAAALSVIGRATSAEGCVAVVVPETGNTQRVAQSGEPHQGVAGESVDALLREAILEDADRVVDLDGVPIAALPCGRSAEGRAAMLAWRKTGAAAFSDTDQALLNAARPQLAYGIVQVMEGRRLRRQAEHDMLTGLLNRAALTRQIATCLERVDRGHGALLYIDLDNFKAVNDSRGHAEGDLALTRVSALFRKELRDGDLAGRIGGDEFVLWLDDRSPAGARDAAEQLVVAGRSLGDLSASADRPLGLSIGVALAPPSRRESVTAMIERADRAMYAAKRTAKQRRAQGGWGMADGDPAI